MISYHSRDYNLGIIQGHSRVTSILQPASHQSNAKNLLPFTEQSEIQPSPSPLVPFRRDQDFVDRGTLLDQIHEKCSTTGSRTALVGLGGVG
jgi:hypothetical protein